MTAAELGPSLELINSVNEGFLTDEEAHRWS
jgi:hypothetical protein